MKPLRLIADNESRIAKLVLRGGFDIEAGQRG